MNHFQFKIIVLADFLNIFHETHVERAKNSFVYICIICHFSISLAGCLKRKKLFDPTDQFVLDRILMSVKNAAKVNLYLVIYPRRSG